MKVSEIKKIIESIVNDGTGIVYDDDGSGCGGPGYLEPETLTEMLQKGEFDDAAIVKFDEELATNAFAHTSCRWQESDSDLIQIEFNFSENGYHLIAWIWAI